MRIYCSVCNGGTCDRNCKCRKRDSDVGGAVGGCAKQGYLENAVVVDANGATIVALRGDGGRAGRSRRLLETSPTAQAPWPMMSRLSTFENAPGAGCANVCFGSVSDIAQRPRHVRYSPQSGPSSARVARPLCANSTSGALWGLGSLTCYDDDAVNTNAKLTLLVFIVFFLALALAALWML